MSTIFDLKARGFCDRKNNMVDEVVNVFGGRSRECLSKNDKVLVRHHLALFTFFYRYPRFTD
jgi:hypothetical protein